MKKMLIVCSLVFNILFCKYYYKKEVTYLTGYIQ
jgi:hypothetical protein